jgi:hypothetical protein
MQRRRATDEPLEPGESVARATVARPRDDRGHCWDGLACDYPGHEGGVEAGIIHLIH